MPEALDYGIRDPFDDRISFRWIPNFWTERITHIANRSWKIGALSRRLTDLRDGTAFALLAKEFGKRGDYRVVPVKEKSKFTPVALESWEDLIMLGRHEAFAKTRFSTYARWLIDECQGEFIRRTRNGYQAIRCQDQIYQRHVFPSTIGGHQFPKTDYGLIVFGRTTVGTGEHSVVNIGGIGSLGTLGATAILANKAAREELARQARKLLVPNASHRPDLFSEFCIRFDLYAGEDLAQLCQDRDLTKGTLPFGWCLEYVSLARETGGYDVAFRRDRPIALEYILHRSARPTISVRRFPRAPFVNLAPLRTKLLLLLTELPNSCTIPDLCARLQVFRDSLPRKRSTGPYLANTLSALVTDVNRDLNRIAGTHGTHYIYFDHNRLIYVLNGIEIVPAKLRRRVVPVPPDSDEESDLG